MVTGGKGGVGKSTVAMAMLDILGPSAVLVETDTSNPDVAKAYADTNTTHALDLDERGGWIELVDLANETDGPLVINGAAGSLGGLKNVEILTGAIEELGRKLIVLFVMSRTRDSLELLADHRAILPLEAARTWAVLNAFYGTSDQFKRYHESNQKKEIEASAGTLLFPDLADRVLDQINNERLTIAKAAEVLTIGNRSELNNWRSAAQAELKKALG